MGKAYTQTQTIHTTKAHWRRQLPQKTARQQLNKCCCPGALGAEPRINDSTSKPLTSSVSLQTPLKPTPTSTPLTTRQPTNGTRALCSSQRLFINSLFVCFWRSSTSKPHLIPPTITERQNKLLSKDKRTAKHHPWVTVRGNKRTGLANPKILKPTRTL